jgi:hypothetical protein
MRQPQLFACALEVSGAKATPSYHGRLLASLGDLAAACHHQNLAVVPNRCPAQPGREARRRVSRKILERLATFGSACRSMRLVSDLFRHNVMPPHVGRPGVGPDRVRLVCSSERRAGPPPSRFHRCSVLSHDGLPRHQLSLALGVMILLAEDSEFNAELLLQLLGTRGHRCQVASSGDHRTGTPRPRFRRACRGRGELARARCRASSRNGASACRDDRLRVFVRRTGRRRSRE